jgi:hypothetical protein
MKCAANFSVWELSTVRQRWWWNTAMPLFFDYANP